MNAVVTLLNAGLAKSYTDRVVEVMQVQGMLVKAIVECPESGIREVCTLVVSADGSVDYRS